MGLFSRSSSAPPAAPADVTAFEPAEHVDTGALISLRNSHRQAELFERRILPATQRILDNLRSSYASGRTTYLDLIDAQRALLDVRLAVAEARTMREKRLAEVEMLAGVDVETLLPSSTHQAQRGSADAGLAAASASRPEVHDHE